MFKLCSYVSLKVWVLKIFSANELAKPLIYTNVQTVLGRL